MGIVSNWGNLPTAVVQTMAREAPFDPATDVDLGVAYIAIFILLMNSVFFALGVRKVSAALPSACFG
jgi:soluble lytic murein transglycosylase-like protein